MRADSRMHKQDKSHLFLPWLTRFPAPSATEVLDQTGTCFSANASRDADEEDDKSAWSQETAASLKLYIFLGVQLSERVCTDQLETKQQVWGVRRGYSTLYIPAMAGILALGEAPYGTYTPEVHSLKDDFDPDFSRALSFPYLTRQGAENREEAGPKAGTACACWLQDEKPSFLPRQLPRRSRRSCCHCYRCHQKPLQPSTHSQLDDVPVNHVGLTKTAVFFPSIFSAFYHYLLLGKLRCSTKAGKITMALSPDLKSI